MSWKPREWALVGVLLLAMPWTMARMTDVAFAQGTAIATTEISDTVYRADGTPAGGTVIVSWPAFTTSNGLAVSSGNTSATLGAGGSLNLQLVPNAGSNPMGSYYTAVFHLDDGSVTREYWVIPSSTAPVALNAIRSTVLPTSVAMQTVSKAYVDTAITAAVTGHPLDESTPYVQKTGDTMTGPLVLPGDPTAALQAADKHYVDVNVTSVESGLAQKVSLLPSGTQTVAQSTGTQLQVNRLNGSEYASQYVSGDGNNGIVNAVSSPDCTGGCDVKVEPSYNSTEVPVTQSWNSSSTGGTHVEDDRNGERKDSYMNPLNLSSTGGDAGQWIDVVSTRDSAAENKLNGAQEIFSRGLSISHEGLTGGTNLFPQDIDASIPYFKTTYSALDVEGTYNTSGQHVLAPHQITCYGVGDCLAGAQFITASGGFRDNADEGVHPMDLSVAEDTVVFQGVCSTGCTTGSTTVGIATTNAPKTQGEGRFLIDTNPAKVISTGQLIGGADGVPGKIGNFSGTSFPVSTFLTVLPSIPSQANDLAPGTVTVAIATSGVTAGFATNTAALPSTSGVACLSDVPNGFSAHNYEMANYTVVDGTHLQLTLNKPHEPGTTIGVGGLCGYGLEQTVDTVRGIRQVFPVFGSISPTSLYYAGGVSGYIGDSGTTSGYVNVSMPIATIVRNGGVVTLTTAGNVPADFSGLTMTVAGVTDGSYNGSFAVTGTGPNTLTYNDAGANSTSSGGTLSYLTGGYTLYPMAEVLGVFNAATKQIDGQMTLAANTVPWAPNDSVEEPHYYQERIGGDTQFISQTIPRPYYNFYTGIQYQLNVGANIHGFTIANGAPASNYFGNGGTHLVPEVAYEATGIWRRTLDAQAGDESVFSIHCNSHGCGKWDSAYNLFELDTNVGGDTVSFQPMTSNLTMNLRGTSYGFTPQGFTAGTINAGTVNATTLNGAVSASGLPLFGASGPGHAQGAVPDPGAAAGTTHYLREDGTWAVPPGSGSGTSSGTTTALSMPQRASLLGEYLLNEGNGTVANDTSGLGNNATISGATWDGEADLNFGAIGEYIQLPVALNQSNTFQFAIYAPAAGSGSMPLPSGYSTFGANPSLLCGTDTNHTCLIESSYLAGLSQRFYGFNSSHTESQEFLTAGWHIVTFVNGLGSDRDHWYYDGGEVNGYVAQGSGGILHPTSGNYQIGGSTAFTGTWWVGKVAGAWAWSTALSPIDVAAAAKSAMDFIKSKGAAMPYRASVGTSPVVIGGLDSRTAGFGVTTPWINNLSLSDSTYTTLNLGVAGLGAIDTNAMYEMMYAPHISEDSPATILALWGGVNDMTGGSDRVPLIATSLKSIVQKAKAQGAQVILATEIDSTGNDARKNELDAILRSQAYSWGVDNLADLATIPQLGADGAASNSTYFTGGLHPVDAGEVFITGVMSNAVNELIGSTETNRHTTATTSYQEVAGDRYLDLTGTSAQTVSLPDCIGYSLPRQMVNLGSVAATAVAINGETLTGNSSIAVGTRAVFVPVPGALSTGGCQWERTQ